MVQQCSGWSWDALGVHNAEVVLGGYWAKVQRCSWGSSDAQVSQWDAQEMLGSTGAMLGDTGGILAMTCDARGMRAMRGKAR